MSVGVHALGANNGVERFKGLSGKQDGRAESADVLSDMEEYMEFGLVYPAYVPSYGTYEEVPDFDVNNILSSESITHI